MLEMGLVAAICGLGLLAFFEPCTIATHTLFAVRNHQQETKQGFTGLVLVWLSKSVFFSLWLVIMVLLTKPPELQNITMAMALAIMAAVYIVSKKVYLPIPHFEFWRFIPGQKNLPESIRLGLTFPACTLPLIAVTTFIVISVDDIGFAIIAGLLWSSFFTLPIAMIIWRGIEKAGRDFLNHAASSTAYLTAVIFLISALFIILPDFNLRPTGLKEVLSEASFLGIVVGFLAGFVFSFNPVSFASVPVVLAYVTGAHGERRALYLGGAFIAGLILTHVTLGVVAALSGDWVKSLLGREWGLLLGPLLIIMGLMWAGFIQIKLPWFSTGAKKVNGAWGAFLLGIPFSVAICPFCAPALLIALTASAAIGSVSFGFALLFAFALGRSIPIILGAWAVGWLESLQVLSRYQRGLEIGGGLLLILSGLYLLNEYLFIIKY